MSGRKSPWKRKRKPKVVYELVYVLSPHSFLGAPPSLRRQYVEDIERLLADKTADLQSLKKSLRVISDEEALAQLPNGNSKWYQSK